MGQVTEAEVCFRRAVELSPTDQQGWLGLGQTLQAKGDLKEADATYAKVIELDARTKAAEVARQERTNLAQHAFRRAGIARPDAAMFCLSAIQKFEKMNRQEIQKIGFEIAIMGQRGLDTNNATPQYQLKSLPGQFSGLQLVCTMYVAFKMTAPEQDIGFDLSNEYRMAKALHEGSEK